MSTKKILVDGINYVPESSLNKSLPAKSLKGLKYCLVRGYQSGLWAGYIKSQEGTSVVLVNAKNIWYWKGSNSLAQLSQEGIKNVSESKITQVVPEMTILDANSLFPCTAKAQECIEGAPDWKA